MLRAACTAAFAAVAVAVAVAAAGASATAALSNCTDSSACSASSTSSSVGPELPKVPAAQVVECASADPPAAAETFMGGTMLRAACTAAIAVAADAASTAAACASARASCSHSNCIDPSACSASSTSSSVGPAISMSVGIHCLGHLMMPAVHFCSWQATSLLHSNYR